MNRIRKSFRGFVGALALAAALPAGAGSSGFVRLRGQRRRNDTMR